LNLLTHLFENVDNTLKSSGVGFLTHDLFDSSNAVAALNL
jgi:hypothetical protein